MKLFWQRTDHSCASAAPAALSTDRSWDKSFRQSQAPRSQQTSSCDLENFSSKSCCKTWHQTDVLHPALTLHMRAVHGCTRCMHPFLQGTQMNSRQVTATNTVEDRGCLPVSQPHRERAPGPRRGPGRSAEPPAQSPQQKREAGEPGVPRPVRCRAGGGSPAGAAERAPRPRRWVPLRPAAGGGTEGGADPAPSHRILWSCGPGPAQLPCFLPVMLLVPVWRDPGQPHGA